MASCIMSTNSAAQVARNAASRKQLHVAVVTGRLHWGDCEPFALYCRSLQIRPMTCTALYLVLFGCWNLPTLQPPRTAAESVKRPCPKQFEASCLLGQVVTLSRLRANRLQAAYAFSYFSSFSWLWQ
jgi:hypothetical protein